MSSVYYLCCCCSASDSQGETGQSLICYYSSSNLYEALPILLPIAALEKNNLSGASFIYIFYHSAQYTLDYTYFLYICLSCTLSFLRIGLFSF